MTFPMRLRAAFINVALAPWVGLGWLVGAIGRGAWRVCKALAGAGHLIGLAVWSGGRLATVGQRPHRVRTPSDDARVYTADRWAQEYKGTAQVLLMVGAGVGLLLGLALSAYVLPLERLPGSRWHEQAALARRLAAVEDVADEYEEAVGAALDDIREMGYAGRIHINKRTGYVMQMKDISGNCGDIAVFDEGGGRWNVQPVTDSYQC